METELEDAIKNNEFVIFLQPKFDTMSEAIVGAEALIRRKVGDKIIFPNQFIEKYEERGCIVKLDMYVLEEICKLQRRWKEKGFKVLPISINQSRHHLKDGEYIKKLKQIIEKYDIDPRLIEFEMTETSVIEDIELAKNIGKEVKSLGFNISMDDFGTGYSAFNVLKEIEIDVLKIDKKFFENLEENVRAQIIIETIVKMCKRLNIKTVAEGIETRQQVEFLKQIECDIIQGYYFSKPISIENFEINFLI